MNKSSEINMLVMGDFDGSHPGDISGYAGYLGYNATAPTSMWVKVFNSHELYAWRQEYNGYPQTPTYTITQNTLPTTALALGHEIGHRLGLWHNFDGGNGCADASIPYANKGQTNNLMDYGGGAALTPCQLGVVNINLYNPSNPANSYINYLSTSFCNEVPARAFFVMDPCLHPGDVKMDSRGTFMADRMTIKIYFYDPTAMTGRGALITTYSSNVTQGGKWNLANLHAFAAGQDYYVELTASKFSGQQHTRGQVIHVYGQTEGPCFLSSRQGK